MAKSRRDKITKKQSGRLVRKHLQPCAPECKKAVINCIKCGKDIEYKDNCSRSHVLRGHMRQCLREKEEISIENDEISSEDYFQSADDTESLPVQLPQPTINSLCCLEHYLFQQTLQNIFFNTRDTFDKFNSLFSFSSQLKEPLLCDVE